MLDCIDNLSFVLVGVAGRFDEIFFLDLPQMQEREQIFKIHVQDFRPNTWKSFDYNKASQISWVVNSLSS